MMTVVPGRMGLQANGTGRNIPSLSNDLRLFTDYTKHTSTNTHRRFYRGTRPAASFIHINLTKIINFINFINFINIVNNIIFAINKTILSISFFTLIQGEIYYNYYAINRFNIIIINCEKTR